MKNLVFVVLDNSAANCPILVKFGYMCIVGPRRQPRNQSRDRK